MSFFQANMLQKVLLIFSLCALQFPFHHSRYVLIDVDDDDNGIRKAAGCGELCLYDDYCTKDPRCPHCWEFLHMCGTDPNSIRTSDDDNGVRIAGCGGWCWNSGNCGNPVCPYCVAFRCVHNV